MYFNNVISIIIFYMFSYIYHTYNTLNNRTHYPGVNSDFEFLFSASAHFLTGNEV